LPVIYKCVGEDNGKAARDDLGSEFEIGTPFDFGDFAKYGVRSFGRRFRNVVGSGGKRREEIIGSG
jgi:hypothetical protein